MTQITSKSSLAFTVAVLAQLSNGLMREEKRPKFTSSMTVEEKTHTQHTTDEHGNFSHPFHQVASDVQSIFYPESKTISTKLHRVQGPSRHHANNNTGRAFGSKNVQTKAKSSSGYWEQIMNWVSPTYGGDMYTTPMTNYWNLLYLGEIYMGTPASGDQQAFMVVWDTGSGGYLSRGSLCSGCDGDKFQIDDSTTFAWKSPDEYDSVTYMDGTSLYGQLAYDRVCPTTNDDSCADDFLFVAISSASGLRDYEDGIIGLWSGNSDSYTNEEEMIMNKMFTDSTIDEKVFSFYLTDLSESSYIDFGTPNTAVMSDVNDIIYIDIIDNDIWWTAKMQGLRWGSSMNDDTEYAIIEANALTDTGTSCIIGPTQEVSSIRNSLLGQADDVQSDSSWDFTYPCSEVSKMAGFEMLYGGYWMEVTAEDLSIDIYSDNSRCSLCLSAYDIDYWILGDAFMRGWYNIHDHTNLRMGFVPFADSAKEVPVLADSIPTTLLPDVEAPSSGFGTLFGMDATTFLIVVALTVVITGTIVVIVIFFCASVLFNKKLVKTSNQNKSSFKDKAAKSNANFESESEVSLIILQ